VSPLGQYIGIAFREGDPGELHEIVGVLDSLPQDAIDRVPVPAMYVPLEQGFWPIGSYVARTSLEPAAAARRLREALGQAFSNQALENFRTVEGVVSEALTQPRVSAAAVSVFALVALALAAVGLYGVILQEVTDRSSEIGIRMALGATAADVRRLILWTALPMVAGGLLVGVLISAGLRDLLSSLLFGVSSADPVSVGAALSVLVVTALLACLIPAQRAAQTNAAEILRPRE
jgi:putative ABC transport system permease protein